MAANSKSINRNTRFTLWSKTYADNELFGQLQATRTRAKTLRDALNKAAAEHAAEGTLTEKGLQQKMAGIRELTRKEIATLRESVITRARKLAEPLLPKIERLPDEKVERLAKWWASAKFNQRLNAIRAAIMGQDDDMARAIVTEPLHFPVTEMNRSLIERRFVPEHDPTTDDLLHAARLVDEELGEIEQELT